LRASASAAAASGSTGIVTSTVSPFGPPRNQHNSTGGGMHLGRLMGSRPWHR
jgi:hypothetical protein